VDEPVDEPEVEMTVRGVADELRDTRRRGLDELDIDVPRKERVALPRLERLARLYLKEPHLARIEAIKRLLRSALVAYSERNPGYAATAQQLFFGADLNAEPLPGPSELLDDARSKARLDEKRFYARQAAILQDFASFLIEFVGATGSDEVRLPPSQPAIGFWRRPSTLALVAAGGVAALAVGLVLANRGGGSGSPSSTSPSLSHGSTVSSNASSAPGGTLRFDDLGGGSSTIFVYPGVKTAAADKQANGTFTSGQTVQARCKTTGRLIVSDTAGGERPKQSTVWIEIAGEPGQRQFATMTYADVSPATLAQLPNCANVP
jgi:hypothetical protein